MGLHSADPSSDDLYQLGVTAGPGSGIGAPGHGDRLGAHVDSAPAGPGRTAPTMEAAPVVVCLGSPAAMGDGAGAVTAAGTTAPGPPGGVRREAGAEARVSTRSTRLRPRRRRRKMRLLYLM